MDVTGILGVLGFWIFVIALVLKKPLMVYLEKNKDAASSGGPGIDAVTERVQQLEGIVSQLTTQVGELKDNAEYSQRLLIESAQRMEEAQAVLIESAQQAQVLIENAQHGNGGIKLIEAAPPESMGSVIDASTVRFERYLPAQASEVWKYFTEAPYLAKWLAQANVEPRVGGRVELNFDVQEMPERKEKGARIIGLIKNFEPFKKLAYSWMDTSNDLDSAVSLEFREEGNRTAVVLTHSRLPQSRMHEFMAGWHAHLDILAARLANLVPPDFSERFGQVVHKYAAIVASTIVVSSTTMAAMPAEAATGGGIDNNTYQSIKAERSELMKQYDLLWRDVDEHQRRVDGLKREKSIEAQREVDQLDRQLEDEYRDLHSLEIQIKDLDKILQ